MMCFVENEPASCLNPLELNEKFESCAVRLPLVACNRCPKESCRARGNLRRAWLRRPEPFEVPVKIGELAVDVDRYVFVEDELNLVHTDSDLLNLSPLQETQVDVCTESVHV